MLKDFLEKVVTLSGEAQTPIYLPDKPGQDPRKRLLWDPMNEGIHEIELPNPPRGHLVATLDSFRAAVKTFRYSDADPLAVDRPPVLWVSMSQVVAVFDDDAFRQSKTTWKIQPSHVFEEINGPNKFDHQEFVRFIRHTIAGVDFDPDDFVDSVLAVTFATGSETRSEITRGKNTLGKTVMREVTGFARIPEDVVLTFEPFPSSDIFTTKKKVSVNCSVFTDATDQTIELTPKPGQIDAAKAEALDALRLRVAEVTGLSLDRVLAGTP